MAFYYIQIHAHEPSLSILAHFYQPRNPEPILSTLTPFPKLINSIFVSVDLSILGILYKWNHIVYGLCGWILLLSIMLSAETYALIS
jgi:hypothetical protein